MGLPVRLKRMVRLDDVEQLPKGKALKKAPIVEAKRGGQCGWREALPVGQEHPGKLVKSRPGKLMVSAHLLFEHSLWQWVQILAQAKAHQKTS